jgi:hypothetical protein
MGSEASVDIGGPGAASGSGLGPGSFPVWPVVGGFAAVLVAAVVLIGIVRRHGSSAPAPAA